MTEGITDHSYAARKAAMLIYGVCPGNYYRTRHF